jgi:hypothetical protein
MIRKDYIVRQIEEFGKALAQIRYFNRNNDFEKFEKEISAAVQTFTSLEIGYVEDLNDADFTTNILLSEELNPEKKKMLADLLFEKLHYYLMHDEDEKGLMAKARCLKIYQELARNSVDTAYNLDVHYKIQYLETI